VIPLTDAQKIALLREVMALRRADRAQQAAIVQANPRNVIVLAAHRRATSPLLQNGGVL
jgi:hypothetical protein